MWVASPWGFSEMTIQPTRHECQACCLLRQGWTGGLGPGWAIQEEGPPPLTPLFKLITKLRVDEGITLCKQYLGLHRILYWNLWFLYKIRAPLGAAGGGGPPGPLVGPRGYPPLGARSGFPYLKPCPVRPCTTGWIPGFFSLLRTTRVAVVSSRLCIVISENPRKLATHMVYKEGWGRWGRVNQRVTKSNVLQ